MQEATQQVLKEAQDTLDEIIRSDNLDEAVVANMGRIDDAFMHVLEARLIHADQSGRHEEAEKLARIQQVIISQIQGETPPEVQFLTQLISAQTKSDRERLMTASPDMLSAQLIVLIDLLREQAAGAGQDDLVNRLGEVKSEITAKLLVAGNN